MRYCNRCPIYNRERKTCGTARSPEDPAFDPDALGCFCIMPVKAGHLENCYLYDESNGRYGWPDELNSYPHAKAIED